MTKHPLAVYLEESGETLTAFAGRVDASRTTIYRLMNSEGETTTGLIKRICAATGGAVKPADFFQSEENAA